MNKSSILFFALISMTLGACGDHNHAQDQGDHADHKHTSEDMHNHAHTLAKDHHSYSEPNEVRVTHLSWDAAVNFETKVISAKADWTLDRITSKTSVIFDINDVNVIQVKDQHGDVLDFSVGSEDKFLGESLTINLLDGSEHVIIEYKTQPDASALLWVEGDKPFLFSQSQAILGRTWIPCQDSPGVRFTYDAKVKVREDLMALMSAENPQTLNTTGEYSFKMGQPIPSYLLALAVGNVEFRPIGDRTGVYATPELIDAAEYEFQDMDNMLVEAEKLYGKYVWGRYDLLILPPAFPFGGMENPRLTFATPTIIAGDRSLTSLVAHELAHSWSGNLVTNSTWDDFWLNEGFTVYFEQRIMEAVYGREYSEMLASLSFQGLVEEVAEISEENPADTHLKLSLKGRNPDDGMTAIAYDKGYMLLRLMEETVGRERFDTFINTYFSSHSFQVMDTERFITYLKKNLLSDEEVETIKLNDWIYGKGLPSNTPVIKSDRMTKVNEMSALWSKGDLSTDSIPWKEWSYQEKYRFLKNLDANVTKDQMTALDNAFDITKTGNNEVLFAWLEQVIDKEYSEAYPRLETFLVTVGRRKFLTPLYTAMKENGKLEMAKDIYKKARPNYHAVATQTMDELLNGEG